MLTEQQRDQILALLKEGLESKPIAERVGVSLGTVRSVRANLTMGHYGDIAAISEVAEVADAIDTTFGLERDLQSALRHNIAQLENGLKVIDGGTEQTVSSGRIDITAEDKDKNTVVIELKAGTADRETIGQILGYMGDLQRHSEKPVRGIIIAGDFASPAISALSALPHLQLKKYSFKFSFQPIGPDDHGR